MKGILGKKLGMTRVVNEIGHYVPITIVQCTDNVIHQLKNEDKDGYNAVVLGFEPRRHPTKTKKFYYVKEIKVENLDQLEKGGSVSIEAVFTAGDLVTVTGVTKGKGMQGVMKRYNFHGGPASHGSHHKREPGSVGSCAKPGRIHRGKKLPGHMGNEQQTLRSTVAYIDQENSLIGIKGPVPGSINSYVTIKKLS